MIHETLDQLEARLNTLAVSESDRAELLTLVGAVRTQVEHTLAAHPSTLELSGPLRDLSVAIDQFGANHPDAKQALDSVVQALGRLGL